ncbi:hypothetical protein NLI96_g1984 [Meripilus lineatus]|uniref:Velvet domain-containing protein n=1 Tax=Meripilus lineatus TaxID=2056292 RepID=A0AAD5YMF0_9APHY|nr:hypothetical protein NLI96_g1984 [Physisporinus lineatus]
MTTHTATVLAETTSLSQPVACQGGEALVFQPPCHSRHSRHRSKDSALTRVPLSWQSRNPGKCLFATTPSEPESDDPTLDQLSPDTSIHLHASDPRPPEQPPSHSSPYNGRALRSPGSRQRSHWHNLDSSRSEVRHVHASSEYPDRPARSYRLEVVQHPLKTAEFGSSTLTRLPLAPPLIAQLHIRDQGGSVEMDETELPFLIAQLSLYSADGTTALDMASGGGQSAPQRLLFTYPGLPTVAEQGLVLARARSLPFDVLSRNEYVAPVQTPLTQYFLQQGARMYAFASSFQFVSGSR